MTRFFQIGKTTLPVIGLSAILGFGFMLHQHHENITNSLLQPAPMTGINLYNSSGDGTVTITEHGKESKKLHKTSYSTTATDQITKLIDTEIISFINDATIDKSQLTQKITDILQKEGQSTISSNDQEKINIASSIKNFHSQIQSVNDALNKLKADKNQKEKNLKKFNNNQKQYQSSEQTAKNDIVEHTLAIANYTKDDVAAKTPIAQQELKQTLSEHSQIQQKHTTLSNKIKNKQEEIKTMNKKVNKKQGAIKKIQNDIIKLTAQINSLTTASNLAPNDQLNKLSKAKTEQTLKQQKFETQLQKSKDKLTSLKDEESKQSKEFVLLDTKYKESKDKQDKQTKTFQQLLGRKKQYDARDQDKQFLDEGLQEAKGLIKSTKKQISSCSKKITKITANITSKEQQQSNLQKLQEEQDAQLAILGIV